FHLLDDKGSDTGELLREFRAGGRVDAPRPVGWWAARLDDEETTAVIAEHHERSGVLLDPHTAVGVGAVDRIDDLPDAPVVCLATAHPAKFPDAVEKATGVRPPLPPHLADLLDRPERYEHVEGHLGAVERIVRAAIDR
ncbi:MAG: threonine synthase, partial [Acidimicrobiales bacterium]